MVRRTAPGIRLRTCWPEISRSYSQADSQLIFYDRYKIFEPYFQDDWRITKRFTLNLGLRWSFFGRYQERYNTEFGFTPSQFSQANALGNFSR